MRIIMLNIYEITLPYCFFQWHFGKITRTLLSGPIKTVVILVNVSRLPYVKNIFVIFTCYQCLLKPT